MTQPMESHTRIMAGVTTQTTSKAVPVRAIAWMLAVVMFIMGSDLNIVSPLLAAMSRSFSVHLALAGWLVTAFALGYALASPLSGWASDRLGRVGMLAAGMGGFVLFETASAVAPSLWTEVGARALAGVFAGAVSPVAYALVGDVVPKNHRAGTMAILSMGFSVSTVAGVPLGLWLAAWTGWRGALFAIGAALFLAGVPLLYMLGRSVPRLRPRTASTASGGWLGALWPQLGASFAAFSAMGLVYTYLPTALMNRGVAPYPWLMAILAVYGTFNLAGNRFFGWCGDRVGAGPAVRQAQVFEMAVLVVMAVFARISMLWPLALSTWLFAFSQAYIPDLKALASDVPLRWRGTSLAINNTAMYSGMVFGSALANAVYPRGHFAWLSGLGAILIGAGWAMMRKSRRFWQVPVIRDRH